MEKNYFDQHEIFQSNYNWDTIYNLPFYLSFFHLRNIIWIEFRRNITYFEKESCVVKHVNIAIKLQLRCNSRYIFLSLCTVYNLNRFTRDYFEKELFNIISIIISKFRNCNVILFVLKNYFDQHVFQLNYNLFLFIFLPFAR